MTERTEFFERLRLARREAGFKTPRDAANAYGWNENTYKSREGGIRGMPKADEVRKYARAFRVSFAWLMSGEGEPRGRETVSIVGKAGAGPDGSILFSESQGELGDAPMPPGGNERTVAVEVEGTSMRGIAEDGWLIYYDDRRSPIESDMIGELCVLGLADGRVLVKKPFRSRIDGYFDLESTFADTMREVAVEWGALVTAILPRRTAMRLNKATAIAAPPKRLARR